MKKYEKIKSPFKRCVNNTSEVDYGNWTTPEIEMLKDISWIATEKIDGTNCGIIWNGYEITYQGRTKKTQFPQHSLEALDKIFKAEGMEEKFEEIFGDNEVILFGELYGKKIQKGEIYRDDISFALFDVYWVESDVYNNISAIADIASKLGIDMAPLIFQPTTLKYAMQYVAQKPTSIISLKEQKPVMEGLVLRPLYELRDKNGERILLKIKVKDFKNYVE